MRLLILLLGLGLLAAPAGYCLAVGGPAAALGGAAALLWLGLAILVFLEYRGGPPDENP